MCVWLVCVLTVFIDMNISEVRYSYPPCPSA